MSTKPAKTRRSRSLRSVPPLAREVVLDIHDIQGNIFVGFNKDQQLLIALRLRDIAAARYWLGRILPYVNSVAEVGQFNKLFHARRLRLSGADPDGLTATWANIAFSHNGLARLTSKTEADGVPDESFRVGMPDQAAALGDRAPLGQIEVTKNWKVGGKGNIPDVLLIIASDDEVQLEQLAELMRPTVGDTSAPEVVWEEMGRTRRDLPGHEHFGFKDGISHPAVRGLTDVHLNSYLSERLLEAAQVGDVEFASPGNPLVWPGQFVFGYPSTNGSSDNGGEPVEPPELNPKWLKNG